METNRLAQDAGSRLRGGARPCARGPEDRRLRVLTQIDIQATLQEKLGLDFRSYRILGACNPGLAHGALGHDLAAGVLIPCNVALYEEDDGKATVIAVSTR